MTPTKTPFAGLEALGAGDPLSSDGYYFQRVNPYLIDRLLQIGAVTHRHNAAAALADPTLAPTLATNPTGGTIPANTRVYVVYTLRDANGGETAPVAVGSVLTPPGYATPTNSPAAALDHTAGTLLSGNYSYAVTVTDGNGGETTIGPARQITVPPGSPHSEVALSGLSAITDASSGSDTAAGWRLWRKQGGGPWYLIATGTHSADTFTDGGVAGDCTVAPPTTSTTSATNELQVTVPGGQPSGTVNFVIYASLDGSFISPAALGTYPIADAGTMKTYTSLAVTDGQPPVESTCVPGANQINALTDIINISGIALPTLPIAAVVTANETAPVNELIPVDATGANVAIALPTGRSAGTLTAVMKEDATTHTVSVTGNIRGVAASTENLGLQNSTIILIADSAGSWWPIAGYRSLAALDARYLQVGSSMPTLTFAATVTANGNAVVGKHNPVDATSAAITISLPAGQAAGAITSIEKIDSSSNAVTVSGNLRDVAGQSTILRLQHETVWLIVDASGSWWPIASHRSVAALDTRYLQLPTVAGTVTANGAAVVGKHNPVNATGGAVTLTLPTGAAQGALLGVEKDDSSTNAVTITGNVWGVATQTIVLNLQHESVLFMADASGSWWPIGGFKSDATLDARYQAKFLTATQQSAAYTFQSSDAGTVVESTAASGVTFTVPTGLPTGMVIEVFQDGAGQVTIAGATGVSLRSDGTKVKTSGQYATIGLRHRGSDEWVLTGDLA